MFNDLREYIDKCQEIGELQVIEGADWDLEYSLIAELYREVPNPPLLLFDKIKGYPNGYRLLVNPRGGRRHELIEGLPPGFSNLKREEQVKFYRNKYASLKLLPPTKVKSGPVMENVVTGDAVDLFAFPAPKVHPLDAGREIGTEHLVITRDPDEGWVNLGTYRVQIHNKNTATIFMVHGSGRHGDLMRQKYWAKGQSCPVAVSCGQVPELFHSSTINLPWGVSEYDWAGGWRNKPIEVIEGITTGLPIPATAELVLEGEILPPGVEDYREGPFGEWSGHYASVATEPALKVKSICYRNNPIITCIGGGRHLSRGGAASPDLAARVLDVLDKLMPGGGLAVRDIGLLPGPGGYSPIVISLKQQAEGHAKQVALAVAAAFMKDRKYVVVVDEDIDPTNVYEVLWALSMRCEPETSIQIIPGCLGGEMLPMLSPEKRARGQYDQSMAIILACKPYHWIKQFPPRTKTSLELLEKTKKKWRHLFGEGSAVTVDPEILL